MTICTDRAKLLFWKEARSFDPGRWHAYDESGSSLCGKFVVVGIGQPRGARMKAPQTKRCGACLSKVRSGL